MARKAQVISTIGMLLFYAFAFSVSPVFSYASRLRATLDPILIRKANNLTTGYIGAFALIFAFLIIYKFYLKIFYIKLANRYPRQNMVIITNTGMYKEEGVGIVDPEKVDISKIRVEEYMRDDDIKNIFKERREWLKKFYKFDDDNSNTKKDDLLSKNFNEYIDVIDGKNYIISEFSDLDERNFNFHAYKMDYLLTKDLGSYFNDEQLDFLKSKQITSVKDYINTDDNRLKEIENEYNSKIPEEIMLRKLQANLKDLTRILVNETTSDVDKSILVKKTFDKPLDDNVEKSLLNIDFKSIQIKLLNTVDVFNNDEISFFRSKGIYNFQDMLNSDLLKLSNEFNEHFKAKNVKEKIKNALKSIAGKDYAVDNVNLIGLVKELKIKIINIEKKFMYKISDDKRIKMIYLKLVALKAVHYGYHAYLIQFDKRITVPVGKTYDVSDPLERFIRDLDDFEQKIELEIDKALVILPATLENSFSYSLGYLNDFHGVGIECEQVTDVEYIYRGMLDSEHGIFFCNNCSYLREAIKVKVLEDPLTMQKIERGALLFSLNEANMRYDGIKKFLELQKMRLKKKDDQMDFVLAKIVEDLDTLDTARKWMIEKKPFNIYQMIICIIISIAMFFAGIAIMAGSMGMIGAIGGNTPPTTLSIMELLSIS